MIPKVNNMSLEISECTLLTLDANGPYIKRPERLMYVQFTSCVLCLPREKFPNTQNMKFSTNDFFSKRDQIRSYLRICSRLVDFFTKRK